ncbi:Manganese transporter smf1 [Linderina macrospora]|uniref:Manganese transporter smf1 n=1 Tax=Linderina macrospora TaxID=4868 RepID=A0ACC1IYV2_9FUNG|nr:Manganese transporter smf1 [Linderina macrospora]
MDFTPVNPKPFLTSLVGSPVVVRLKWGQEYKGRLVSIDSYMNIQLVDAEEFQDGNSTGELPGELLIRCNNVLYVRELVLEPPVKDQEMAEPDEGQMEEGEQNA